MASIQVKNDRYYFVYYDGAQGKHRWKSSGIPVDTKNPKKSELMATMALGEFMATLEGRIVEEEPVRKKVNPANVQYADFLNTWLAERSKTIRKDTYEGYESALRVHLVPYFKEHPVSLAKITSDHLQAYLDSKRPALAVKTLTMHRAIMGAALDLAIKQQLIPYQEYLRDVVLPKVPRFNSDFLDRSQIDILLQRSSGDSCFPAFYLAAKLGLRRSEVCGLRWQAIDFSKKRVRINHTAIKTKTNGLMFCDSTKNESSNRELPLTPKVLSYLKALKAHQTEMRLFMGEKYDNRYLDYVCVHDDGRIILPDSITVSLKKWSAKLSSELGFPTIRLHDLRHSFATNLIREGVNIKVVSKMLGHSTEATTLRIYYHVLSDDFVQALNSADSKMAM